MAEKPAPLDVLQEPDAQPGAAVRALDEPRDVGHDECAGRRSRRHDAQVRHQGREGVVGDLRAWPPRWREMSVDLPAFGRPMIPTSARSLSSRASLRSSPVRPGLANRGACGSGSRSARCPGRRCRPWRGRTRSSGATRSASCLPLSTSVTIEPSGTRSIQVVSRLAVPVGAHAVLAALGAVVSSGGGDGRACCSEGSATGQTDAAVPPSPPEGPPARHELLAAERDAAVAAVAGLDVDLSGVDEHRKPEGRREDGGRKRGIESDSDRTAVGRYRLPSTRLTPRRARSRYGGRGGPCRGSARCRRPWRRACRPCPGRR